MKANIYFSLPRFVIEVKKGENKYEKLFLFEVVIKNSKQKRIIHFVGSLRDDERAHKYILFCGRKFFLKKHDKFCPIIPKFLS